MDDQLSDAKEVINSSSGLAIQGNVDTSGGDFTGRDKITNVLGDEIHGDKVGGDKVTIGTLINNLFGGASEEVRRLRNRQAMLRLVKEIWIKGILEPSLANHVLIDLRLDLQPEAVNRPGDALLPLVQKLPDHLPPDPKIDNIFEEMNQSLLILGEPGAGKTIILLELAKAMLAKAEQDLTQPIPVVFQLASWVNKQQPLAAWLIDELRSKYYIPQKVAQSWVEQDELLLLLDGLDEVKLTARANCIEAINTFQQQRTAFIPLALCCRTTDYMLQPARLNLHGAIVLQPLTAQQLDSYLEQVTSSDVIRQALQSDPSLQEFTQSPLVLNTIILAYQSRPVEELLSLNVDQARRQRLFDTYIKQMFEHQRPTRAYPPARTLRWLVWLAQQLTEHNQTIFLIEQMQPGWLATRAWRWFYLLTSRVLGGSLAGLIVWLMLFIGERDLPGFSVAFMHQFPSHPHVPAPFDGLVALVTLNWGIGLVVGLIDGIFFEYHQSWSEVIRFRQWHIRLHRLLLGTVVMALVMALLLLFDQPAQVFLVGLLESVSFVVGFGYLEHIHNLDGEIQTVEALSWSWREAAKGGLVGVILGLLSGSVMERRYGVFHGFIFFFTFSLLFIALGGLRRNQLNEKQRPNQGMQLSLTNSLWAALLFGLLFTTAYSLFMPFAMAWPRAALFVLVGWLLYGGTVLMKHGGVYLLLWFNGCISWNYARFLEYCADRIFLRKVGGGYIFIHRLLMEHFASLTEEDIQRLSSSDPIV